MNVNNVAILVQKKTLRPRVRYGIRKAIFLKVRRVRLSQSTLLDWVDLSCLTLLYFASIMLLLKVNMTRS